MVSQGDIIKVNLNPVQGREQAGYRPCLVVSKDIYHRMTNLCVICPISNTDNTFPMHIDLPNGLQTTGKVLTQHIRTIDINNRSYTLVESVPREYLEKIIDITCSIIK